MIMSLLQNQIEQTKAPTTDDLNQQLLDQILDNYIQSSQIKAAQKTSGALYNSNFQLMPEVSRIDEQAMLEALMLTNNKSQLAMEASSDSTVMLLQAEIEKLTNQVQEYEQLKATQV